MNSSEMVERDASLLIPKNWDRKCFGSMPWWGQLFTRKNEKIEEYNIWKATWNDHMPFWVYLTAMRPFFPLFLLIKWIISSAIIQLYVVWLPRMKPDWGAWGREEIFSISTQLILKVVYIYKVLQRLIGHNWWTIYGVGTLGLRTI